MTVYLYKYFYKKFNETLKINYNHRKEKLDHFSLLA